MKEIMNKILLLIITSSVLITSCMKTEKTENPLLNEFTTPNNVPPFDKIEPGHYMEAFENAIEKHNAEIEAIVSNEEQPTFENTVVALDRSGTDLARISRVFYNLNSANTSDTMQAIARKVSPMLAAHRDNIVLNAELFQKIKTVFDARAEQNFTSSELRALEKHYETFERNGANLSAEDQVKLREYNQKLSKLTLKFGENLLAETNENFELVVENEADLAGCTDGIKTAAAEAASERGYEGKWVFTTQKPSMIPFLTYAENRDLREQLYRGYFMRGNNNNEFDNKEIILDIVKTRALKANLLGYETHAHYVIDVNMAKLPENVNDFLFKLWYPALEVAKKERAAMQEIVYNEGNDFKLESWDWWLYAEKLRKEKYDLDENEIRPYFELENTRDGMFWLATKLYGVEFTERTDLPIYHEEVEVFEVKEADGKYIGLLYLDYHPRASKRVGAWNTSYQRAVSIDGVKTDPISSIVCNFTAPTGDMPALLTWDEVETLFHEFGHALHGLFTEGNFYKTAGSVARDYVELPSQIMENWASESEVLKQYAFHYETEMLIPDELIQKIQASSLFNQGFATVEYLAAAILDMKWHMLTADDEVTDVLEFEKKAMNEIGLIEEIIPRYRSTYFSHIFSGGYSAGYYVYEWAGLLDADAFNAFKESGDIFNKELADKFRLYCLANSGEADGMELYKKFRGQEPSIDPLLKRRGLK
jgi:peptidyl-dipeptidase Dcp